MNAPISQEPGDWIEWSGGECPVASGTKTEVQFRDGKTDSFKEPDVWDWSHSPADPEMDIVAYRALP